MTNDEIPAQGAVRRSSMGLTADCFPFGRKGATALDLLDYCHALGAGGVEAPLGSLEIEHTQKVRQRAEKLGMYLEVWATLPKEDSSAFQRTVAAAKEAGAARLRAFCLGGRRYEAFTSLDDWKRFVAESRDRIRRQEAYRRYEQSGVQDAAGFHRWEHQWETCEAGRLCASRSAGEPRSVG